MIVLKPTALLSFCLILLSSFPGVASAQNAGSPAGQPAQGPQIPPSAESLRLNYTLGPGDVIQIRGVREQDFGERTFRIESNGEITLPLVGLIRMAGLTVEQVQAELNNRLRAFYVNPQAIVTLVQFRSEPVFFIGLFKSPGIYPLQGRRTLVEMLSTVGGLAPNASRRIRLTRRMEMGPIALPNAVQDPNGKGMTVEIPLNVLTRDINPPEDLLLMPYDVLSVDRAELVYLSGGVAKPGGYELGEKETISALQVLTLAGGLTSDASPQNARILRPISNSPRRAEIPFNLKNTMENQGRDANLQPGDVLYVPRGSKRALWGRVAMTAIPLAGSALVAVLVSRN